MVFVTASIEKNEKKSFKSVARKKSNSYICSTNNVKSHAWNLECSGMWLFLLGIFITFYYQLML